jgi:hypothetical protein
MKNYLMKKLMSIGVLLLLTLGISGCITTGGGAEYAPSEHIDICTQNLDDHGRNAKDGALGLVWYWENKRFEAKHFESVLRAFNNPELKSNTKAVLVPILNDPLVPVSEIDEILDVELDEKILREVLKLRLNRIETYGEAKKFARERLDSQIPLVRYASVYLIREYLIQESEYERFFVELLVARLQEGHNNSRELSASVAELMVRTLGEAATSGQNKYAPLYLETVYPVLNGIGANMFIEYESDRMPQRPKLEGDDVRAASNLFSTRLFPYVN